MADPDPNPNPNPNPNSNPNLSNRRLLFDSYNLIGCEKKTSDEDVVVACYRFTSSSTLNEAAPPSLKAIAHARQSPFLFFVISIYRHLNDKHVASLAKKSPFTSSDTEAEIAKEPKSVDSASTTANSSSETERDRDEYGELCDTSEATSDADVLECESPSSSEADISSSSEETNADSDSEEEEVGGAYFDDTTWRCESCCHELVDGHCPNSHDSLRCTSCDWQLVGGLCPMCHDKCEDCGAEKSYGKCLDCVSDKESDEEDNIAHDYQDGVWRCIYCQWEVEADNDEDANCHCLKSNGEARNLDLRDCLDYEPADSCSSESESSDEEPDSEDDRFIDDESISLEGQFDPKIEIINLAGALSPFSSGPIQRAAEEAKAMIAKQEKEDQPAETSSDDLKIIDTAPTGDPTITDCEPIHE